MSNYNVGEIILIAEGESILTLRKVYRYSAWTEQCASKLSINVWAEKKIVAFGCDCEYLQQSEVLCEVQAIVGGGRSKLRFVVWANE